MNAATQQRLAELREAGVTAEGAAEALAREPRFARRIESAQLRGLFAGTLIGIKLQDAIGNEALPLALRQGLRRVVMTVNWADGYLDTTDPEHAAELRAGISALVQHAVLSEAEGAAVLEPAGGPMLEPLSAAEITAYWEAEEAERTRTERERRGAELYNRLVTATRDGRDTSVLLDELEAGLIALEA